MTAITNNAVDTIAAVLANEAGSPTLDARSMMLRDAAAIVTIVLDGENKLDVTAKAWGASLFHAVYTDGQNMDAMIGDSKAAAGWPSLTSTDAGKKAKARLEVYFSNARLVAENWASFDSDAQRDIIGGLVSIHYQAGLIRKAAADAKRAADKEAKRLKAEEEAAKAKAEAVHADGVPAPAPATLADAAMTFMLAYEAATSTERRDVDDVITAIVAIFNRDMEEAGATVEEVPVAVAA